MIPNNSHKISNKELKCGGTPGQGERCGLVQIVDAVFEQFTDKVRDDSFEPIHGQSESGVFVRALGESEHFRNLVADIMVAARVPPENVNMLVNYIAYISYAGYKICGTERMTQSLEKLM